MTTRIFSDMDRAGTTAVSAQAALEEPRRERLPRHALGVQLREHCFSPSKLAALVAVGRELGLDPHAVLDGTGLTPESIADPFTLTSSMQFLEAARNAVRLYREPDLGVRVGRRMHVSDYGMYGYALLCSETLRRAFDTAVKYHQLANPMLDIRWLERDDALVWVFPEREEIPLPDLDVPLYDFLIDLQFTVHVTLTKDIMGSWCVPARAGFMRAQPPHAPALAEALECPLAFDQPQNVLSYPASWLSRSPRLANSITAAQVSKHCAHQLEQLRWQAGITRRVYQELTRTPGQFPDIEQIAECLCMTSRTLRRKLEAEGTSYSELFTSVRKALAIDYLTTTSLGIDDIAQTLGFSDSVGFRHAFKRWTGKTPSEVRRTRSLGLDDAIGAV
nr:AraC family transcriptional regulator [Trinickia dabaoshanensis]